MGQVFHFSGNFIVDRISNGKCGSQCIAPDDRKRNSIVEILVFVPDSRRLFPFQCLLDQRLVSHALSAGRRPIGSRQDRAGRIGYDNEIAAQVRFLLFCLIENAL